MMATRKLTKTEVKRDAIRAAEIFGLTISKNAANTDSVVVSDPSDENGWFGEFGGYDAAYKYLSKVHRDKQDFGTPYPWVTWKEKRQKNPAPLALALTPKQYHDAKLRAIADEYGIELSEVREMYDTEGGRAENDAEWVKLVLDAANRGAELSRLTLDKFFELRPSAKLPESAIPNGYQRPEARKMERQKNPATKLPTYKPGTKDPAEMSAGEINKEMAKIDALRSTLTDWFIENGRGNERSSETLEKSDPAALLFKSLWARRTDLKNEVRARYGPGAEYLSSLPSKFGPRKKNPATKLPAKTADVRGAARRYMDFTGHAPGVVGEVNIKIPKAVAVIGSCDGILYTTVRDGKTERYIHEFKKADAPTFTVTPDGKGIFLIGGRYDFTERGIVDASDPTSPRKRRQ